MNCRFSVLTIALCSTLLVPITTRAQDTAPPTAAKKSTRKPQSELASKTAKFATVAEGDAKVKAATPATDLDAAKKMVGKEGAFVGTVAKVFAPSSNSLVILNFARDYKTATTAVIKAREFAKFPDLETLKGKKILVTGKFISYEGATEIEVSGLDQIKIVK